MLDPNKVKIGIAPIAWTEDDMPELMGADTTFGQTVSEIALAGYEGTEIGSHPSSVVVLGKFRRFYFLSFFIDSLKPHFFPYLQQKFNAHFGLFLLKKFF